jgi:hypothetical protein
LLFVLEEILIKGKVMESHYYFALETDMKSAQNLIYTIIRQASTKVFFKKLFYQWRVALLGYLISSLHVQSTTSMVGSSRDVMRNEECNKKY